MFFFRKGDTVIAPMRDVFVCHTAEDTAAAEKVCEFLEREKIACWTAPRDSAPGENEQSMIEAAVEACPVTLLIFSQSANESALLQDQIERALRAEKILIPLRIENVAPAGRLETSLRHRFRHDAFVPPLERHLPELVRMLKPLLHRLVVKTREATSISRTLPSRSSVVRGQENKKEPAAGGRPALLALAFSFPHPLFAGHPGEIDLRVTGGDRLAKATVEISLEGLGLLRIVVLTLDDLGARPEQMHRVTIVPARSGVYPLHAVVTVNDEARRTQFSGQRSLRVNQARALTDRMRVDEVMVNDDKADLFLAAPADPAKAEAPVGELRVVGVPENFEPMELTEDFEIDRWTLEALKPGETLRIPPAFEGKGRAGTRLRLEPAVQAADLPFQEIRLVARPEFSVGRSREESDYLAWFWPRNEVHDTKTRRVSKKHCSFHREGALIVLRNVAAGSLTTFDGQDLGAEETMRLDGIGTLNLSGIYQLVVARFPSTLAGDSAAPHEETPRGSLSFSSSSPNTLPQHVLWLLTDGSFGTSRANPLPLDFSGLADIQGRFHHDQGMFWIESIADNGGVEVEGVALSHGLVAPLAQGMTVRLGSQLFRVGLED